MINECRYPVEFVFDENLTLERLQEYKAIIMPTVAVLSDEHTKMCLEYVKQGGLIIAAGETGLYSMEDHQLVKGQRLLDALGVSYQGQSDYSISYFTLCDKAEHENRPVLIRDGYNKYYCQDANCIVAHVVDPICETTDEVFFHNNLPAPYEVTEHPAIMDIPYGEGRVVLFAQDIFSQFARYHQLELKGLMTNTLQTNTGKPAVVCSASSNVQVISSMIDGKLVVHLINMNPGMGVCCGEMDAFEARYPRTFEFVEQVDALADVSVHVSTSSINSCHAFIGDEVIPLEKTGDGYRCTLKRLGAWETLIFE